MNQTRLASLIETLLNTLIGFAVSYLAWPIAAQAFGVPYSQGQHVGIVLFFTVLSILRGYVIRRFFNGRLQRAAARMANAISQEDKL